MGWLSNAWNSVKSAVSSAANAVVGVVKNVTASPIVQAVASFIPGGSAVLGIANKVSNIGSSVAAAVTPAVAAVAAPAISAAPNITPVPASSVPASAVDVAKSGVTLTPANVAYATLTERMRKEAK